MSTPWDEIASSLLGTPYVPPPEPIADDDEFNDDDDDVFDDDDTPQYGEDVHDEDE